MHKRSMAGLGLVLVASAACGDGFGPQTWDPGPDTTVIYSITRPELINLPAAYDFISLRRVAVENASATGGWDVVLAEQGGRFVLVPAGVFPGLSSRAGIARVTAATLEEVRRAPGDTASYSSQPVPIDVGAIYVVRTRRESCAGFGQGVRYAKLEAIAVDATAGTFQFAVSRNPYCNNRDLIPPDS